MAAALIIFVASYVLIATEKWPRYAVALLGATALVVAGIFPVQAALASVDWETIGFLFGMLILVTVLADSGFFTWFAGSIVDRLDYRPTRVFLILPLVAGVLAALMGSITVMLFLSALTLRIARSIHIDPLPLIAAEVCASNAGGTATLMGNPPNVIMGNMLGVSFNAFLVHSLPLAVVSTVACTLAFYALNRKDLVAAEHDGLPPHRLDEVEVVANRRLLLVGLAGMGAALLLLMTRDALASATGLQISTAVAALLPALLVLLIGGDDTRHIMGRLDIESLLFFVGLFIVIAGLEQTHVIRELAGAVFAVAGSSQVPLLMALYWGSGLASAVVDNVPMALAMVHVIRSMAELPGVPAVAIMVWSLVMGLNVGGNITPVGASANVLAYTFLERHHCRIGWPRWFALTAPPTLIAMAIVGALLILKYNAGWY